MKKTGLPMLRTVGDLVNVLGLHAVKRHQLVVRLLVYLRDENLVRRLFIEGPPERLSLRLQLRVATAHAYVSLVLIQRLLLQLVLLGQQLCHASRRMFI
jgi:hypothetical protein